NCPHSSAHPAAHSNPASPPADAPHRLILNHAQHSRHSNPHSARRTALVSLPAVSSLGGFPTPAAHARATPPSAAGIRKPSQKQTSTTLINHLVSTRQQHRPHGDAECPGRL